MKEKMLGYKWGIIITLAYIIVSVTTLSHYGVDIDEPAHFTRGQAYLDMLLTGHPKYSPQEFSKNATFSEWKIPQYDGSYYLKNDSGHPSTNDVLAALFNKVLFEKLHIMGDLESYHLFEVLSSALLIFLIYYFMRNRYGEFAGTVSSLALTLYPLFYGESHFNIKDPVEASFYTGALLFFYLGLERKKARFIFVSAVFCALAFGTKFNVIFLPFILVPYILIRYLPFIRKYRLKVFKRIPKSFYLTLLIYPIIIAAIHIYTRPFLWSDPYHRFLEIIQYYKDIGTGTAYQKAYIFHHVNLYPIFFTSISTPLYTLFLSLLGVLYSIFILLKKEKDKFALLIVIFFSFTIFRVSLPGSSIYGGVRQIMEYVPAMSMLAGIGALFLRNYLARYLGIFIATILLLILFIPNIVTLIRFHPNENVYINELVGGVKGASEKKIPGALETMGNVYLQGVQWLDKNGGDSPRFGVPEGLLSNIPRPLVSKKVKFGPYFSGTSRAGEYMIEMNSVEFPFPKYNFDYLNNYLIPVHMITIDGVPIMKIWKNDAAHTKPGYLEDEEVSDVKLITPPNNDFIEVTFPKSIVTRIEVDHDTSNNCLAEDSGTVAYSPDGKNEVNAPDDLFRWQGPYAFSLQTPTHFVYFFAAVTAEKIKIIPNDTNLCLLQVKSVKVFKLKDKNP
ncbi:MAG TPA: glycosyltransferase family 39 protein [Candidatus Saccharimonadales bacterium]|nr:glycosyltransferase family 39 protein [Candidatus Saccharimonadales bacterium]